MKHLSQKHVANQKEMVIGKNIQPDIPANFPRPKNGLYQILRKDVINIVRPIRPEWINKAVKTHNTAILQLYRENCALKEANEALEKDMRLIKGMFPDVFPAPLDEESSEEDKPEEKVIIESKIQVVDEKKIGFFDRLLKKKPTQFVEEEVKPKMKEPKEKKGIFNGFKKLIKSVLGKGDHSQEPPLIKTASIKEESNLNDDEVKRRTKVVELQNQENTKESTHSKQARPPKTDPIMDDDIVYDEVQSVEEVKKKVVHTTNATKNGRTRSKEARQPIKQKVDMSPAIEKERGSSSKAPKVMYSYLISNEKQEQPKTWKWAYRNGRWHELK